MEEECKLRIVSGNEKNPNSHKETCDAVSDVEERLVSGVKVYKSRTSDSQGRLRKWLILGGCFFCLFLSDGFIFHLSILFLELQNEFHKTRAETALVQSVASGSFHIGGILAGMIVTRLGLFKAGLVGASLEFVGLFSSYFAPNIPYLAVTLGFITGFGTSITYVFATANIGVYFKGKTRLTALSIIHVGAGIGGMTHPYLINTLSFTFGWRGALLVLAAIIAHLYVIVLMTSLRTTYKSSLKRSDSSFCCKIKYTQEDKLTSSNKKQTKGMNKTFTIMKNVVQNRTFFVYLVVSTVSQSLNIINAIIFVDYFAYKGFSRSKSLFAYFIMTVCSVLSRFAPGFLKKLPHVGVLGIQATVTGIGACTFGCFPVAVSYESHICLACFTGIFFGATVCLVSVCCMKLLGPEHFPIGSGLTLTLPGFVIIGGGPLAGFIKDYTGSYDDLYFGSCILLAVSTVIVIVIAWTRRRNTLQQDIQIDINKDSYSDSVDKEAEYSASRHTENEIN